MSTEILSTILDTLNQAQLKAVKHNPTIPLQILAGPGSGKTKVLTARIAHLILDLSIPPSSICAVTFTNKAANEMRERLQKLIGPGAIKMVKVGTFHALCSIFLRKYATVVDLPHNFTVCDAEESKKIISTLLKSYKSDLESERITLTEGTVMSIISKAKAKGLSSSEYITDFQSKHRADGAANTGSIGYKIDSVVGEIYTDYEQTLRKHKSLDFDDLLLFGVKLFQRHDDAVDWCSHVLVDEFQDTNTTQYELMSALAVKKCVTIVGDPDQSIYGWRSAEVANLRKMQKDFPSTKQILLEQNYRSTGSILKASLAIVAEDKTRIVKSLIASHATGAKPVLQTFESESSEAVFIASEIKRLVAHMGGALTWGDFVVLLRFNALSRTIENALQREGIPSRVLAGHKFFERLEIKDILAYLQLIDNEDYFPAFRRAVNVPSRGIGEKTVSELLKRAEHSSLSPLQLVEKIVDGRTPDIKPPIKRKLAEFVEAMRTLKGLAEDGTSPSDLIKQLVQAIGYEEYLNWNHKDWQSRWENVQELINFASEVKVEYTGETDPETTPLRMFLQASMLSSEGDNDAVHSKEKVTISTCHSAKGLEWPVVMIPGVENAIFPFYRTEDVEEERRLLYVACTRAQSLLYLSSATARKVGGSTKEKKVSDFITSAISNNAGIFASYPSAVDKRMREVICQTLGRLAPSDEDVTLKMNHFRLITSGSPGNSEDKSASTLQQKTKPALKGQAPVSPSQPSNFNNQFVSSAIVARCPNLSVSIAPQNLVSSTAPIANIMPYRSPPIPIPSPVPAQVQRHPSGHIIPGHLTVAPIPYPHATRSVVGLPSGENMATGTKRRLGMGTGGSGYSNKKFKGHKK